VGIYETTVRIRLSTPKSAEISGVKNED